MDYVWLKAFHVIAVISWMAALLYLPRLFVYHVAAPNGSPLSETLKIMERRLQRAIMTPAMLATLLSGAMLIYLEPVWLAQPWMHTKLTLVLGLSAVHGMLARWRRGFDEDRNTHSHVFFRVANEVPTVLMIGIVILVVVKPF
jgi:putative membrane protein